MSIQAANLPFADTLRRPVAAWLGFLRLCAAAIITLTMSPAARAHGDGTTGGELFADKDGTTVSTTLSIRGLLSAGIVAPEMMALPDLFDAKDQPVPQLVDLTHLLMVVRADETILPTTIEPGPMDPEAMQRMVRFHWTLPPGSRSFSIERRDPDTKGGIASWAFFQAREEGTSPEPHYAQALYGDRVTFALASTSVTSGVEEGAEPVTETGTLGAGSLLGLGFRHIVPEGVDHVLFILALFLPVPRLRPLVAQATAFTLAHSITLGLAMAGVVVAPSRAVEIIIALSILVMALGNLRTKEVKAGRWALVFGFGLVHGLGFAGSFSQLSASPGDLGRTLLFLNLGIEFAQLAVLIVLALLVHLVREKPWYRSRVVVPVSLAVAAFAAWLVAERSFFTTA